MTELQRKEITEVIDAKLALLEGLKKTFEDKKFNIMEVVNFLPFAKAMPAAIKGIETIPDSFNSFSAEDRTYFSDYIEKKFDIEDDVKENAIELIVDWALYTVLVVKTVIGSFAPEPEEEE